MSAPAERAERAWRQCAQSAEEAWRDGRAHGSQPPSWGVAARHPSWTVDALDRRLHAARPPLIGRIQDGRLLLDARTLADEDIAAAARALGETAPDAAETGAP